MRDSTVDVHHHILPPSYTRALGERIGHQGLFGSPPAWTPQTSIEVMDRNGIGFAIVSVSAPGVWFGDPQESERLARECNDYSARMKADFPDRFGFFATLPLPDIDMTLREIERVFDTLDANGVVLMTNYGGLYPGDARFRPVFEELDRRRGMLFFHPAGAAYPNPLPHIALPRVSVRDYEGNHKPALQRHARTIPQCALHLRACGRSCSVSRHAHRAVDGASRARNLRSGGGIERAQASVF